MEKNELKWGLVEALKDLKKIHGYISKAWVQDLDHKYPYDESFDDLYEKVAAWVEFHTEGK